MSSRLPGKKICDHLAECQVGRLSAWYGWKGMCLHAAYSSQIVKHDDNDEDDEDTALESNFRVPLGLCVQYVSGMIREILSVV